MAPPPLVLLHAFPVDSRMWDGIRAPVAAHTRLITPDQRGLGRSPLPATDRAPTLDDAARDVLAMLDKLGLDRVALGGCSMGGYLTMAVLRAAPERLAGLVLMDTKATADTEQARDNRLAVAARAEQETGLRWLADGMLRNLLGANTKIARPDVLRRAREMIESQPPAGVAWAQRAMAARPDATETLLSAEVPALVIAGAQDTLTPPATAREMADGLPGSRLLILPGAGHLSPMEDPAAVSGALCDWLDELPAH